MKIINVDRELQKIKQLGYDVIYNFTFLEEYGRDGHWIRERYYMEQSIEDYVYSYVAKQILSDHKRHSQTLGQQ